MRSTRRSFAHGTVAGLLALGVFASACTTAAAVPESVEPAIPDTRQLGAADGAASDLLPAGATDPTTAPVEPIRFISPDEWAIVRVQCLASHGFTASVTPDGGVAYPSVPTEQQPILNLVIEDCDQLYPVDPRYAEPLTQPQLEFLYGWYVNTSVPCLVSIGYGGFSPPTLDVFAERYSTDPWVPYADIAEALDNLTETDWYDLQEACPQSPPTEYLFGK